MYPQPHSFSHYPEPMIIVWMVTQQRRFYAQLSLHQNRSVRRPPGLSTCTGSTSQFPGLPLEAACSQISSSASNCLRCRSIFQLWAVIGCLMHFSKQHRWYLNVATACSLMPWLIVIRLQMEARKLLLPKIVHLSYKSCIFISRICLFWSSKAISFTQAGFITRSNFCYLPKR